MRLSWFLFIHWATSLCCLESIFFNVYFYKSHRSRQGKYSVSEFKVTRETGEDDEADNVNYDETNPDVETGPDTSAQDGNNSSLFITLPDQDCLRPELRQDLDQIRPGSDCQKIGRY